MAKIFIEDIEYEVPDGKNMLEVCLSLGFNLTYFCWHPALHSVGACRQCAVMNYKDEEDKRGRLTMACMLAANNNTRISIEAAKAHDFRAGNIESLMINHPHDCPVCDEGGECHLQDMTVMSGHNYRRYRFKKRTHYNQYLGPFVNHEMNRCIQCYRCVRFYKDYAGGKDLDVFAAHDDVYFGRSEPGILENEFSGNLVEVCPTGVFTDKTLKQHYTRKWDLTNAPSICRQCGLGCNILAAERYGTIRRILTRYNGDVNGYFLCDRGRFGYEYVNSKKRILFPSKKETNQHTIIDKNTILNEIKTNTDSGKKVIGIGSPRASLESNFVLNELVGDENFYAGISNTEGNLIKQIISILKDGKVKTPSLAEAKEYDVVFILGEDVTNTAPMLALSLRQAAKNKPNKEALKLKIPVWNDAATRELSQGANGPFYIAATHATKLGEISTQSYYAHPDNIARLGFAVAQRINNGLLSVPDLDKETESLASVIADALLGADKPLIVSGSSLFNGAIVQASADISYALKDKGKDVGLIYTVPEANSMGLAMQSNQFLDDAFGKAVNEEIDTILILENDLYQRADKNAVDKFLENCKNKIALDSLENQTTQNVDYVLPAGTFAESDGTIVNNEGRAQRFYQVHVPKNETRSSWAWLDELKDTHRNFDAVVAAMIQKFPDLKKVESVAPSADFRKGTQKIPRETHRFSGRTSMNANINVSEPKPPLDYDSPMSFTMEGFHGLPPAPDTPFYWSPAWNSVQAINKYQIEVGGALHGGNPGKRLLEPSDDNKGDYFQNIPQPFKSKEGECLALPFYHIYGSDELSALSPAVAERIPAAYIALNENDARKAGAKEGDKVSISFSGKELLLPVKYENTLPSGIAGIPKGLKETEGLAYPFWMKIK
jgi:NADH-quinone oxidoreductase subunit G